MAESWRLSLQVDWETQAKQRQGAPTRSPRRPVEAGAEEGLGPGFLDP